ncbi:hypothetical protein MRB53_000138 [Persea americana]|uniref:Uncharacterized protein n=1 Tax=Persea americana TaxID=3435 RepID=A0ACC2MNA0_PERAE|nr:hypothetical protein MRB53_000138 [Persea americana]
MSWGKLKRYLCYIGISGQLKPQSATLRVQTTSKLYSYISPTFTVLLEIARKQSSRKRETLKGFHLCASIWEPNNSVGHKYRTGLGLSD